MEIETPLYYNISDKNLSIRPVAYLILSRSQSLAASILRETCSHDATVFLAGFFSFVFSLQINIALLPNLISCAGLKEKPDDIIHQRASYFRPSLIHQKCLMGELSIQKTPGGRYWQKSNITYEWQNHRSRGQNSRRNVACVSNKRRG